MKRGRILLIGREDDPFCTLLVDRQALFGVQVLFLQENNALPGLRILLNLSDGHSRGAVGFGPELVAFADLDGVIARSYGLVGSAEDFTSKDGQYVTAEWHGFLRGCLSAFACPVVNRPRPELWYKTHLGIPDLMALAPSCGFMFPRVLVTTSPEEAKAFYDRFSGDIAYSPLTYPAHYSICDHERLASLLKLSGCLPLQLVEAVHGVCVPVFVVDDTVLPISQSGSIDSSSPSDILSQCLALSSQLGLTFCRVNLINTPRGAWYCAGVECVPDVLDCSQDAQDTIVNRLLHFIVDSSRITAGAMHGAG